MGEQLLSWHLRKLNSGCCIDPIDSQYSSNNINPYVYKLLQTAVDACLKDSHRCAIIEFGARAGYLGHTICRTNPRIVYTGFEPYPPQGKTFRIQPESCEEALKSRLSIQLVSKADIFVFADVLEHLVDPWSCLQSLNHTAKYGANLIVSIPNFFHHSALSLISDGQFNYEEWGVLDLTHLRFFGLKNITQLLSITGWSIDHSSITPAFDPKGVEILNKFRSGKLRSWTEHKLTWKIDSESDALALAAYQFVLTAKKLA